MTSTALQSDFFQWLDRALSQPLPGAIVAFHLNLYEGTDSVHVQLIGCDSFNPGDDPGTDYWPGDEVFSTGEAVFEVPFAQAGARWQDWLQTLLELARAYLDAGAQAGVLRRSRGVGIGFVDGDMQLLWPPARGHT